MPVIMTMPAEVETWMMASSDETLKRKGRFWKERSSLLPGGVKKDGAEPSAT
jgi:hypothetical protein